MRNLRSHGEPPYAVAVIHGGPGAPGEMAPVARELSLLWGVLEPLQTAASLEGQATELRGVLEEHGDLPVALVGFSWGAWLSTIIAARQPRLVRRLVLVGSGPFEERYVKGILAARLDRLSGEERLEARGLLDELHASTTAEGSKDFARLGELLRKADTYDPLTAATGAGEFQAQIYQGVWEEAAELRRSGRLLELAGRIRCPVVAFHGEHDPHPSAGVLEPLSRTVKDFRFILLEKCGHVPWLERHARERFYQLLRQELS